MFPENSIHDLSTISNCFHPNFQIFPWRSDYTAIGINACCFEVIIDHMDGNTCHRELPENK